MANMKKHSGKIWAVVGVLGLGGLFAWPIMNDENRPIVKAWNDAGIECLSGQQPAAMHIHPRLFITVDGVNEPISGDMGIVRGCMTEVHVHTGEDNVLHVESVFANKEFKLSDFVETIYGQSIEREGYTLEMKVDGELSTEYGEFVFAEDGQVIELEYTSVVESSE